MKKYGRILLLVWLGSALIACSPAGNRTVVNHTDLTFCTIRQTPNLSIYAPWQVRTKRIKLLPGETLSITDKGDDFILDLETCDKRYLVSNYGYRPKPGEIWTITPDKVIDLKAEHVTPTPRPTRIPVQLTILNETGADICSLELSLRLRPYQFGDNVLAKKMTNGWQIVLQEPQTVRYSRSVIKVGLCDGTEYITDEVLFEEIMTIKLRGEGQDSHDLLVEKQETQ